jgi:hypothetical protein
MGKIAIKESNLRLIHLEKRTLDVMGKIASKESNLRLIHLEKRTLDVMGKITSSAGVTLDM